MKAFKLQEITAMKLRCISVEQAALAKAEKEGYEFMASKCREEIELLKIDAMKPQKVLDDIEKFMTKEGE